MTAPSWKIGTYIAARAERQLQRIREHVTAGRGLLAEQAGEQLSFREMVDMREEIIGGQRLVLGDALAYLPTLPDSCVDLIAAGTGGHR